MCVYEKRYWASKFFTEIRKKFNIGENRADFQEKILRGIFFFIIPLSIFIKSIFQLKIIY